MKSLWIKNFDDASEVLKACCSDKVFIQNCVRFSEELIKAFRSGKTVFSCGNGGSYCDALHFAEEMTGRYRKDRKPLAAMALGEAAHMSCVANDYGFDVVFSRQLQALGHEKDVLIVLSTSGQSPSILEVLKAAKEKNIFSVALLGRDGGGAKNLADLSLIVPAQTSDRIQEMHIKILHNVIEMVERDLFPGHY